MCWQDHIHKETQAESVPTAWVPPYKGSSQQHLPSAPSSRPRRQPNHPNPTPSQSSQSSSMAGGMSGRFGLSGLGGVLTSPSVRSQWGPAQQSSISSNPKGLSDTAQVAVLYQTATRRVCMPLWSQGLLHLPLLVMKPSCKIVWHWLTHVALNMVWLHTTCRAHLHVPVGVLHSSECLIPVLAMICHL